MYSIGQDVLSQTSESGSPGQDIMSWLRRPGQDFASCLRRLGQYVLARTFMSNCTSAPSYNLNCFTVMLSRCSKHRKLPKIFLVMLYNSVSQAFMPIGVHLFKYFLTQILWLTVSNSEFDAQEEANNFFPILWASKILCLLFWPLYLYRSSWCSR